MKLNYKILNIIFFLLLQNYQLTSMEQYFDLDDIDSKLKLSSRHTTYNDHIKELITNKNIAAQDKTGKTRLHYAVLLWEYDVMCSLLRQGQELPASNLKNKEGQTPLHLLLKHTPSSEIQTGQVMDLAARFLINNTDPKVTNDEGETLVHYAVHYQSHDAATVEVRKQLIQLFVASGVEIDATDNDGQTALHYAVKPHEPNETKSRQRLEMVPTLFELNANPNAVDKLGNTPLQYAIENTFLFYCDRLPSLVELLITKGCNPSIQNRMGVTPLHALVCAKPNQQTVQFVRLMLKIGANPNVKNKEGYTVLHAAVARERAELVQLLLEHPATDPSILHEPLARTVAPQPLIGRTALDIAREIKSFQLFVPDHCYHGAKMIESKEAIDAIIKLLTDYQKKGTSCENT